MCGLFGYLGKKRKINFPILLSLGIENDTRGGDSCGIFIDGEVEYGIGSNKFFENFYNNSKLLKKYDDASIILGHDRKASVGVISESTAQPVVIRNEETNEVDFVMIHNGTITNYRALEKKYLGEYDYNSTDSQIMAKIIYIHGYDVLTEYEGAGAFVFVDYRTKDRKPLYQLFKGGSLNTVCSSEPSDERPLYYLYDKGGVWFSSISTTFHAITYKKNISVYKLPQNKLVTFENNKLVLIAEYDRSKKIQNPSYNNQYYESIYDKYANAYYNKKINNSTYNVSNTNNIDKNQLILSFENQLKLEKDWLYHINGNLAHGMLILDNDAKVDNKGNIYHFYNGVLVYNYKIYNALTKFASEWNLSSEELYELAKEIIYSFSNNIYLNPENKLFTRFYGGKEILVNGTYTPMLCSEYSKTNFVFKDGSVIKEIVGSTKRVNKEFQHLKTKFDAMTEEQIIDKMYNYTKIAELC